MKKFVPERGSDKPLPASAGRTFSNAGTPKSLRGNLPARLMEKKSKPRLSGSGYVGRTDKYRSLTVAARIGIALEISNIFGSRHRIGVA
ncbi:MAG TPA: hypothetical protein VGY99_08465 [Candidatus Binataceae bacterium]|jgi:hypothetical protein|nr:hypothetical protein [Candidatus Binataceae bacterium]